MTTNQSKNSSQPAMPARAGQAGARFAFFGTPELATVFLDELERSGYMPSIIVTTPDQKRGRGMALSPSPVKVWGQEHGIDVLSPETLDDSVAEALRLHDCSFFLVIYYGKILPRSIFGIPPLGTINVHFSLLPRWKGTSPIRSAILADDGKLGTSLLLMDEKIDHGPLFAQKELPTPVWPPSAKEMERVATIESAALLSSVLPPLLRGELQPQEQNHDIETHCPKIEKADGELDLSADVRKNLLKIKAFDSSVGTFAHFERGGKEIRVAILDAHLENGKLAIDTVKPEGKKEMLYADFLRSGAKPL